MKANARYSDRELLERVTEQPARLPARLRERIERSWQGFPIQLYALADLDEALSLTSSWVVLGPAHVAVTIPSGAGGAPEIHSFARSEIHGVKLEAGLSCQVLRICGKPDTPALATLRFTHRQRRSMEGLVFVLEQALEGREIPLADPDQTYLEAVVRPIREAQALVVANRLAVVWRLLSYLRPYRRQLKLGMASAGAITVLALVPPFLTGYLVDHVIRPVQEGQLSVAQASAVAWLAVIAIAVTYLLRQLCLWMRLRLMATLGEFVARDLRDELYEHLHRLSLSFYSRKKTGSLITRVSSDTDRLWEFLAFGVVEVSLSLVMLVGLAAVLIPLA